MRGKIKKREAAVSAVGYSVFLGFGQIGGEGNETNVSRGSIYAVVYVYPYFFNKRIYMVWMDSTDIL